MQDIKLPACTQLFSCPTFSHAWLSVHYHAKEPWHPAGKKPKSLWQAFFFTCIQQGLVRSHQKYQAFGAQNFSRLRSESWDLTRDSLPDTFIGCMFPIWRTYIKRSNDIVIWLQKQFNRSLERLYVYTSLQSSSRIGILNVEIDHFIENTETSKYPTAKEPTMYGIALMILNHPLMSMMRWRSCFFRWRWAANSSKKTFPLNIPCLTYDLEVTHRKLVYPYTSYESLENNIQNLTTRKCRNSKNQWVCRIPCSSNICILT